jgi:hypothetical protein
VQIRTHRTCFFFKIGDGPGGITINPEIALPGGMAIKPALPESVYNGLQMSVEIIGGKSEAFPRGLTGKITCLNDNLFVIPMAPKMTKHFDPYASDALEDENNSYMAFKRSHPETQRNI